jgi:hypothetical protein
VQAQRESRAIRVPSTAHRADGTPVPHSRRVGSKTQRELGPQDLHQAVEVVQSELLPPPDGGRQILLQPAGCCSTVVLIS